MANAARSVVQAKSGCAVNVMPRRVSLTLDSFAVVPGTTREMKRTFTADCCADI